MFFLQPNASVKTSLSDHGTTPFGYRCAGYTLHDLEYLQVAESWDPFEVY